MIECTKPNGQKVFLAPQAIASVAEASSSSHWHGIRSFIKTFDGATIEVQETAVAIKKAVQEAKS